jgi:hypothetical protein
MFRVIDQDPGVDPYVFQGLWGVLSLYVVQQLETQIIE